MSYAEAPERTLVRIAEDKNWLSQPLNVLSRDLQTCGNESNRTWDSFFYEDRNGILFDPIRNEPIIGADGGDKAQETVNESLQNWFTENDSGIAIRISAKGGMWRYPDNQLEIYRISYKFGSKQKALLCAFHQYDGQIDNPEEMRSSLFTKEDSDKPIFEIIDWAKKISRTEIKYHADNSPEKEEKSRNYAESLKSGVKPVVVFDQMKQSKFLGNNPIGCPPGMFGTASEILGGKSIIMEGKMVRNCGKCGKTINRVIFKGYKCDCGGVYEGC
ncbi:MAG: hypothetical protein AAB622_00555 [Patescibacteria group bacterium]